MNVPRKPAAAADPPRLSKDAIVEEGIRLLSEDGLDGVSLRKLSARLGVRAPSLYWHVPDKDALLAAMLEKLFVACVESMPPQQHWQAWMRGFAAALWHTQEGIRDFGRLLIGTPLSEDQILRTEAVLQRQLAGLDLPVAEALRIQGSVQVLVTGWSIYAHSAFSQALAGRLDFRARAGQDLELLLEGEARRLQSSGAATV